jgi:pimeloyl-ACP methyl ester carboxylesterase
MRSPVVLVHGWKSHPGIWDRLSGVLADRSIPCWIFDHSGMKGAGLETIAASLQAYLRARRDETGCSGPVDMVCHSMGTGIARYMLEVMDGDARSVKIRQLIGLGPPNNGSSLAEIFFDPRYGPRIIRTLGGVFVPRRFNPEEDVIVRQFRPGSEAMIALRTAGLRKDISYRLILTRNPDAVPEFFPSFRGKTWVCSPEGWRTTYSGDGIVPHLDSWLPGAGFDILPADPASLERDADQYCHLHLPRNPEVIRRITEYLCDPAARPGSFCPGHLESPRIGNNGKCSDEGWAAGGT